jgi:ribonuclease P protein component
VWCTWVEDASASSPRVAFAIGRKVGGAVVRNRVRRRLRAVLEGEARRGALPPGDYLIGVRPSAASATFAELAVDLQATLARLRRPGG